MKAKDIYIQTLSKRVYKFQINNKRMHNNCDYKSLSIPHQKYGKLKINRGNNCYTHGLSDD